MRDLAVSSIVLLKNENDILPLHPSSDKIKKIVIIGPNAKAKIFCGGGSSALRASYFISPFDGIVKALEGTGVEVVYHEGVHGECLLYICHRSVLSLSSMAHSTHDRRTHHL